MKLPFSETHPILVPFVFYGVIFLIIIGALSLMKPDPSKIPRPDPYDQRPVPDELR